MRKRVKKLVLARETLTLLTRPDLARALGGENSPTQTCPASGCFICTEAGCTHCCTDTTIE